jgi:polyhydroxyalkanoate synthesis regulator phasin
MLIETLKKTLYAGVGMAFLTRDKIEEMAKKLAEEAKLGESEGRKFIDEMLRKSDEAKASLQRAVDNAVSKAMDSVDLARNRDLKALEARVRALEAARTPAGPGSAG